MVKNLDFGAWPPGPLPFTAGDLSKLLNILVIQFPHWYNGNINGACLVGL